jgi:DNA-binding CsgD family transcriptional regulator
MVRKLTSVERDGLYAPAAQPQGWRALRNPKPATPADELTLIETVILRRVAAGEKTGEIGATLSMSRQSVYTHIARAMTRFGAETREELLDLPRVQELLRGDDAQGT